MKMLSTTEAGRLIGRSDDMIRALAASGRLKGAQKIGGNWIVTEASVLAYQAAGLRPGRPKRKLAVYG